MIGHVAADRFVGHRDLLEVLQFVACYRRDLMRWGSLSSPDHPPSASHGRTGPSSGRRSSSRPRLEGPNTAQRRYTARAAPEDLTLQESPETPTGFPFLTIQL